MHALKREGDLAWSLH